MSKRNFLSKAILSVSKAVTGYTLECELHRAYVSDVERDVRNPTVDVLEQLAKPLGVPASHLLEE